MKGRILLVDDDHVFRLTTSALLRDDGYEVVAVEDGKQAVDQLQRDPFDLLMLDLRLPGTNGIGITEALRLWGHSVPILMISGFGTVDDAVQALQSGTDDFLTKPVDPSVLSDRVARLLERRPTLKDDDGVPTCGLVGRSPAMRSVFSAIQLVAPTDTTVLLTGETGTGKELVARAIHGASARARGPFVAVNCAALAEGLLESELFGHLRGAFTGAIRDRAGMFQSAHGGTLLLDEIGDVSPAVQHRLLRVLQERELTPLGGSAPLRIDVRVIAATNRDLRGEVTAGRFREDLYYRLKVFQLDLPPLRARRGDVPLIVRDWLSRRTGHDAGSAATSCSPFAMRLLQAYDWPGNVRELIAVLESAHVRAAGRRIEAQHLPEEIRATRSPRSVPTSLPAGDAAAEIAAIRAALQEAGGLRARAAELLGMGRTTLWRKIREYGLTEASE